MDLKWFPFDRQLCTLQFESCKFSPRNHDIYIVASISILTSDPFFLLLQDGSSAESYVFEWHSENKKRALGISEEASGLINQEILSVKAGGSTGN
jgi:hypothetical protein